MDRPYSIKLLFIGDDGIGKTSLFHRKGYKKFPVDYIPTVFDGWTEDMVTHNGHRCNIGFWDTVASQEYKRLRPLSYPNTDILAILFSISDRTSYENCLKIWYPESQDHIPNIPIILVGTKSDLRSSITRDSNGLITNEEGLEMANKINAVQYIEVSALNDTNVSELFELVCQTYINKINNQINNSNNNNNNHNNTQYSDSDDEINNKKKCIIN